jgi:kynurenine 3-monooxygenase
MCRPTDTIETRRVIIAGAGPGGLLLQALLHHRNKTSSASTRIIYETTLIESRADLGTLTQEELQAHRSWMIGLANHGLEAVRTVPGLYDSYLAGVGIDVKEFNLFIGSKRISVPPPTVGGAPPQENFIVDRNFIVAALSRYGNEVLKQSAHYHTKYETEMLYVDHANHRVLVRNKRTNEEEYMAYDLLVGADGVRSTVRDALVKKHFDFELSVSDIFQNFKAVHIACPEAISPTALSVLPGCLPHFNGIALPESGGMVNLSLGVSRNNFDSNIDEDIKSDDADVVCNYFKNNLKCFKLTEEGYMDLATQWVTQRWNRTGMVHCNRYSSVECKIVLIGDAAHATSPSIGMGMNTALRDAQQLYELIDKYEDDLEQVLPEFSRIRVPEGNALSDLALHLYCFDTKVGAKTMLKGLVRGALNKLFPRLVEPDCQVYIGQSGYSLADVYQKATEQGIISIHRAVNERIRQEFFERQTGMIVDKPKSSVWKYSLAISAVVAVCGVAIKTKM